MTNAEVDRARAIYQLKHESWHVLVLTEFNEVLLSPPLRRKTDVNELETKLSDWQTHPTATMGPEATSIPVNEIIRTKYHGARGLVDLETSDHIHRLSGWSKRPLIVHEGESSRPGLTGSFGQRSIEDLVGRIELRRSGQPEWVPGRDRRSDEEQPSLQRSHAAERPVIELSDEIAEFSYFSLESLYHFVQLVMISVMFAVVTSYWTSGWRWLTAAAAVWHLFIALSANLPTSVHVSPSGISAGHLYGAHVLTWNAVERFEASPTNRLWILNRPILFVSSELGSKWPMPGTGRLGPKTRTRFLAALERHRPVIEPTTVELDLASSTRRFKRSSKPIIENRARRKSGGRRFWLFAVPLAIIVPFLLVLPFFLTL